MKALLLGDLSPSSVSAPYFKEKNIPLLFGDTVSLFENKDFILVNLECALTERNMIRVEYHEGRPRSSYSVDHACQVLHSPCRMPDHL